MSYLPYPQLNLIESTHFPSTIKVRNTKAFEYWQRSLFQRFLSVLNINVPDKWSGAVKDFLYYCLIRFGYVAVFNTPELGTVFNPCTLSGFSFYYLPTNAIIANPALPRSLNLIIGEQCELLKISPDYRGFWDIIDRYAQQLAELDSAVNLNIINSKYSWILGAKNKAASESLKKAFDKVQNGEPLVVLQSKIPDDSKTKDSPFQFLDFGDLSKNYLVGSMLQDFATLINNFDSEIGIITLPYEKKERLVNAEATMKTQDATSRLETWYNTLKESIKRVNALFPELNLSAEMKQPQERSANINEQCNSYLNRLV